MFFAFYGKAFRRVQNVQFISHAGQGFGEDFPRLANPVGTSCFSYLVGVSDGV